MLARYNDWEFTRNLENAERLLEMELLGWSFRAINDVSCPFNVPQLVQMTLREIFNKRGISYRPVRPPKPEPNGYGKNGRPTYGSEIVVAMNMLSVKGFYGQVGNAMSEAWDSAYRGRQTA